MKTHAFLFASLLVAACAHNPSSVKTAVPPPSVSVAEAAPSKPVTGCFSGMMIVADDDRIEMQGCPKQWEVFSPMMKGNADPEGFDGMVGRSLISVENPTPSRLLVGPDALGRYYFPAEKQPGKPYITLVDGTPYFNWEENGTWRARPLFAAYEVNSYVRNERKLTPFMMPNILGPALVEMAYAHGEIVEGRPFHMLCMADQAERLIVTPK